MPIDTQPLDLVFDQLLKPSKGRKKLSRGYGGWAIFLIKCFCYRWIAMDFVTGFVRLDCMQILNVCFPQKLIYWSANEVEVAS